MRQWIARRDRLGAYHALHEELTSEDPTGFKNFVRMDEESFNELLLKVTPKIQRATTVMREPISAAERLSLTLRFLASGNIVYFLYFINLIEIIFITEKIPSGFC